MSTATERTSDLLTEEQFKQRLLKMGLLTRITPPLAPENYPKDRRPIPIDGKPVSEIIIEDRR